MSVEISGVRVGLRANEPDALALLLDRLPPGWRRSSSATVDRLYSLLAGDDEPRRGVRRLTVLYADTLRLGRTRKLADVLDSFERDVATYVSEHAPGRVFVRAAVVGWEGRAIVLPGESSSGKTTLVRELIRRGATPYADEFAVFDESGRVHPYARPLEMHEHGTHAPGPEAVAALGGAALATGPLPVGLVVAAEYTEGAPASFERLSPGEGALELLKYAVPARRPPETVLAVLARVVAHAPVLMGVCGEAGPATDAILRAADAQART